MCQQAWRSRDASRRRSGYRRATAPVGAPEERDEVALETLPAAQKGWLAGLRDPVVGQALAAVHGRPSDPWTVGRLARLVGLSRSVFAERFMDMAGQPPMQYLALWRMQLASRLLADGGHLSSVADEVGYESEAAFSRAFKKLVGLAHGEGVRPPRRSACGPDGAPLVRRAKETAVV